MPIQDITQMMVNQLSDKAKNHSCEGVPVGTFKGDHPDPLLCWLVYLTLNWFGTVRLHLTNLGIDGNTYGCQTLSSRKHAKGSVLIDQANLFGDIAALDPIALARWAFDYLKTKGATRNWGVETFDQLRRDGKQKKEAVDLTRPDPADTNQLYPF
ncbi:uncharacterized protein CDV56_106292 [Aspergillus thermomutatus]|uniref:Uncharacterized protein n=1 Tax=Aspergillus thermomutatus TaxID=41047 RepID=A0A397HLR6_ASPTH|nr:uncharacterized protein CDV56_106292 [Aspergillus thermomutatus]RHZ62294.1 hypothetical protein CDV56_106292 [Aspergillus thermomutatus]